MLIKEVDRSSVISWSPTPKHSDLLAAGTLSGTMSTDFDTSGRLEIFSTKFSEQSPGSHMALLGSIQVKERFNRLSWKNTHPDRFKYGLLVGGFSSGNLSIWNPEAIIENNGHNPALLAEIKSHSSNISSLDFNPFQSTLLASGGSNSEVFIWNLADPSKPSVYTPGSSPLAQENSDITCVAWNSQQKHILATCAQNGTIAIWHLKEKRAIFSFSDPGHRARYRTIAWHPTDTMTIVAASQSDDCPVLHLWDLSMTMEPSKVLQGHTRGIVNMSWCHEDPSLLVSSGKDNRLICWDVKSGEAISEIGTSSYNFDIQWSPVKPTTLAASSVEGKIRVYSLQDFPNTPPQQSHEFFGQNNTQVAPTIPKRAPSWLRPPIGARFSFGGKLVSFTAKSTNVRIHKVVTESQIADAAQRLGDAIKNDKYIEYCDMKLNQLSSMTGKNVEEERLSWFFIKAALSNPETSKAEIMSHLNYDVETMKQHIDKYLASLPESSEWDQVNLGDGTKIDSVIKNDDEDAFKLLEKKARIMQLKQETNKIDLNNLDEDDSIIMKCLITGNNEKAVECCIRKGNMADALAIAASTGPELWEKALKVYIAKNRSKSYVSVLSAISNKSFVDLVNNIDLKHWKEALAIICSHTTNDIFNTLCETLGDRLRYEQQDMSSAALCYICSGTIQRLSSYWASKLQDGEGQNVFKLHELMEKIVIFSKVSNNTSSSINATDNIKIYYKSYAEVLSSQGLLDLAYYFLSEVQSTDFVDGETQILLDRIYQSQNGQIIQPNRSTGGQWNNQTSSQTKSSMSGQVNKSTPVSNKPKSSRTKESKLRYTPTNKSTMSPSPVSNGYSPVQYNSIPEQKKPELQSAPNFSHSSGPLNPTPYSTASPKNPNLVQPTHSTPTHKPVFQPSKRSVVNRTPVNTNPTPTNTTNNFITGLNPVNQGQSLTHSMPQLGPQQKYNQQQFNPTPNPQNYNQMNQQSLLPQPNPQNNQLYNAPTTSQPQPPIHTPNFSHKPPQPTTPQLQSNMMQPNSMQQNMMQPHSMQPNMMQPNSMQQNMMQPNSMQQNMMQPMQTGQTYPNPTGTFQPTSFQPTHEVQQPSSPTVPPPKGKGRRTTGVKKHPHRAR